MASVQLLLVEDDESIRTFLSTSLKAEGYELHLAHNAREGEQLARSRRIDAFLVDLGLPDLDGIELIQRIREWTQRPVIVLSARSQEREKVAALDAGADDFVTKPFGMAELLARLRVAMRHAAQTSLAGESVIQAGDVRIDLKAQSVHRGQALVRLTGTQWRLLAALAKRANSVVTSTQLLRDVWGPEHAEQGHYLRIYVRQLRQKLESSPTHPQWLLTEPGVGYRLLADGPKPSSAGTNPQM